MTIADTTILPMLTGWLWPFMRITGLMLAAPIFSARSVPVRIKLSVGLTLAWFVMPWITVPVGIEIVSPEGLVALVQEMLLGVAMGFLLQLAFAAVTIAGESIAYSMGLGFALMIDPQNGVQVPVIGQYFVILSTLLFLALGGHLALIQLLVESFQSLPVGAGGLDRNSIWGLASWMSQVYVNAVAIALPVLISILLVNMAFGIITRAAPQLNIFAVGFPITLGLGLWLLVGHAPGQLDRIQNIFYQALGQVSRLTG